VPDFGTSVLGSPQSQLAAALPAVSTRPRSTLRAGRRESIAAIMRERSDPDMLSQPALLEHSE